MGYSPPVPYSRLYVVVRFLLEVLIVRGRSEARLRAEVLALRHQLAVLERQVGRPRWQPSDRLVLAAISRVLSRPGWRSLIPRPETLLRRHRDLVRRKCAAYRRRPPRSRPRGLNEHHDLIVKLAKENEGWGYRRNRWRVAQAGSPLLQPRVCGQETLNAIPPGPPVREDPTCDDARSCFSLSSIPIFRLLLDALIDRRRSDASLRLELLVVRHQLRDLERRVKRPRWRSADRLTLAGLSRHLARPTWVCFLASPQTLLRWHRDLVRRKWAMFARRPLRGRPGLASRVPPAHLRLARENTRRGSATRAV